MISAKNLFFTYRSGRGVFDINFSISEGEVFGFLGPNGAGKTTTIRTLLGFLKPKMGEATINGYSCWEKHHKTNQSIGYLPGEAAYLENMTGLQYLKYVQDLQGSRRLSNKRRDDLIERFSLEPGMKIKRMSKGNKQKIGIVAAFMHDPAVYILDEPTSGLDPLMQHSFVELVKEERQRGKTMLISSHLFEEIDRTSDRVGIIRDGKIVLMEDISVMKEKQQAIIHAELRSEEDVKKLQKARNLTVTVMEDRKVAIEFQGDYAYALSRLSVCNVVEMSITEPSLEDIFFRYYQKEAINE